MRQESRHVAGRGDCILSSDLDSFFKAGMRKSILHTDHRMVLVVLRVEGVMRNRRYVVGRAHWPMVTSTVLP